MSDNLLLNFVSFGTPYCALSLLNQNTMSKMYKSVGRHLYFYLYNM